MHDTSTDSALLMCTDEEAWANTVNLIEKRLAAMDSLVALACEKGDLLGGSEYGSVAYLLRDARKKRCQGWASEIIETINRLFRISGLRLDVSDRPIAHARGEDHFFSVWKPRVWAESILDEFRDARGMAWLGKRAQLDPKLPLAPARSCGSHQTIRMIPLVGYDEINAANLLKSWAFFVLSHQDARAVVSGHASFADECLQLSDVCRDRDKRIYPGDRVHIFGNGAFSIRIGRNHAWLMAKDSWWKLWEAAHPHPETAPWWTISSLRDPCGSLSELARRVVHGDGHPRTLSLGLHPSVRQGYTEFTVHLRTHVWCDMHTFVQYLGALLHHQSLDLSLESVGVVEQFWDWVAASGWNHSGETFSSEQVRVRAFKSKVHIGLCAELADRIEDLMGQGAS